MTLPNPIPSAKDIDYSKLTVMILKGQLRKLNLTFAIYCPLEQNFKAL